MAKDIQSKKRKASIVEAGIEKSKKVKNIPTDSSDLSAKKRKATEDAAPAKSKKSKIPSDTKPAIVDEISSNAGSKINRAGVPKSSKKDKNSAKDLKSKNKHDSNNSDSFVATFEKDTVAKDTKVPNKQTANSINYQVEDLSQRSNEVDEIFEDDVDETSEIDDQTQALLEGFESDEDVAEALNKEGLASGQPVPKRHALSKKQEKKLKMVAESGSEKPGVVYIGRIPHGFYENEMKEYFKQFGNILKLRLSRNKKSGASKHHAWIQFESSTVAEIVAKTMDNYLMFGHLLKVKLVPDEQVHEDLFKGANKRFKKVPWNKIEGRKLEQGLPEDTWEQRVEKEERRRGDKATKLKEIGYEFNSPKIKSARDVLKTKQTISEQAATSEEAEVIDAAQASDKSSKPENGGKQSNSAKGEIQKIVGGLSADEVAELDKKEHRALTVQPSKEDAEESLDALISSEAVKKQGKKPKKDKKRKIEAVNDVAEAPAAQEVLEKKSRVKKSKSLAVEKADSGLKEAAKPKREKSNKA